MTPFTVLTRPDELLRMVPEWAELAADAAEPNAFYEPFALLPAIEHLASTSDVRVLFLRAADGRLIGVVPLERHRWSAAIPAPHFSNWRHRYCFLGTPLLRRGCVDAAVAGLLAWLDGAGMAGRFLRLLGQVGGGAFDRALEAAARQRGHLLRTTGSYERPFLVTGPPPASYFEATVPTKRRSELRRKRKRLDETGELAVVRATNPTELDTWLERFLELEDRGWKGAAGSSMASNPKDRAFLHAMSRRNTDRHGLEVLALTLNGVAIGMAVNLRSGGGVFAFKIAYDEDYGAYSPGMLVDYDFVEGLLSDPTTAWADSCCAADYAPALGLLWADRRTIRHVDLVQGSRVGRGLLAVGEPLQDLATATRAWIRDLPPSVQRPIRRWSNALLG